MVVNTSGGVPGYTYLWSNNQTGASVSGLSAGTYIVSATDLNGCVGTTSVTLTQPEPLGLTMVVTSDYNGRDISCFGYSDGSVRATAYGGMGGYTYQWDASTGNQTTADAVNLPSGTYQVTVTDINNCTFESGIAIYDPPLLTVTTQVSDVVCYGESNGTSLAVASGGTPAYSYSWSANPAHNHLFITGLAPGNYNVTVTDLNNCTATSDFAIQQPPLLITGNQVSPATCFESYDGFGAVIVSGGVGNYTFSWSHNVPTSDSAYAALYQGTYYVTVTDGNGCSALENC
jgi:hypothetical protein